MTKSLILVGLSFFGFALYGQDTITMKNNKVLSVSIIEKSDTKIKYKLEGNQQSNTIFITQTGKLKNIKYANGEIDYLSSLNPRSVHPFGLHVGLKLFFDAALFDGSYFLGLDYFITPKISVEVNFGTPGYYSYLSSFGIKYWFASKESKKGFSPFTGIQLGSFNDANFVELPFGLSYISRFGFQSNLSVSYMRSNRNIFYFYETNRSSISCELRIGWRF